MPPKGGDDEVRRSVPAKDQHAAMSAPRSNPGARATRNSFAAPPSGSRRSRCSRRGSKHSRLAMQHVADRCASRHSACSPESCVHHLAYAAVRPAAPAHLQRQRGAKSTDAICRFEETGAVDERPPGHPTQVVVTGFDAQGSTSASYGSAPTARARTRREQVHARGELGAEESPRLQPQLLAVRPDDAQLRADSPRTARCGRRAPEARPRSTGDVESVHQQQVSTDSWSRRMSVLRTA